VARPVLIEDLFKNYEDAILSLKNNDIDNAATLIDKALEIEPKEALFYGLG